VRLRYAAASGCPDVAAYLEHVRARASNLEVDADPDALPAEDGVDVDVQGQADGWLGRVDITGPSALSREVRGEQCEDVVAALALITVLRFEGAEASALSIAAQTEGTTSTTAPGAGAEAPALSPGSDAAAPTAAAPAPTTEEPPSPEAPATPEEPAAPPVGTPAPSPPAEPSETSPAAPAAPTEPELPPPLEREEGISVRRPPREPEAEPPEVSDTSSTDGAASTWPAMVTSAGVRAGVASVPGRALNVALASELRFGEAAASWAATLSLALAFGRERVEPAALNFTLLTAELGLCPPAFVDQPSLWLRACASVRGGGMRVSISPRVEDVVDEDKSPRAWLVVGPSLELGVPLDEDWTLRGLTAVTAQLIRDSFKLTVTEGAEEREPYPVYTPEAISVELGVGVSYTF
jgi:hypothetical protein